MNIAQTAPIAVMHGGWWILGAAMMMLCMGAMMWMMRGMMGGGSSQRSSAPSESRDPTQQALEILERRFAEGKISVEDYRERRDALTNRAGRERSGVRGSEREEAAEAAGRRKP